MLTIIPEAGRFGTLYYMAGDNRKVLGRKLPLSTPDDLQAVQTMVADALRNYPTVALKLTINRASGSALIPLETLDLSPPALAGPETEEMTHVATRPAPLAPPLPGNMDHTTTYILQLAQNQLAEKTGIIDDLRDDKKRLDETNRGLEKKVMDLEFQLKHKDKEKEYAVNDALAGQPKGLAGLGEAVAPFLSPELVTMLAGRFLGTPMPAAAPQLGSHLGDKHRQTVQALSEWASEHEANANALYTIIQAALSRPDGLEAIMAFVQTTFSPLRASA